MTKPKGRLKSALAASLGAATRDSNLKQAGPDERFARADAAFRGGLRGIEVVRDTFSMPHADHAILQELRARALALAIDANKSVLVRAGLHQLGGLSDEQFRAVVSAVERVKPGRKIVSAMTARPHR